MTTTISVLRSLCAAGVAITLSVPTASAQMSSAHQSQQTSQQQGTPKQGTQKQDDQQRQAPVVVRLDQLEQNPERYLNQRVTVRAEVEDVLGPRLFKIDERNWADLDPEVLVALDVPLAAMVKEDDLVTVTGTMRPFTSVRLDREWGWFDVDPELEARIRTRHILVADTLTGWDDNQLLTIVTAPPESGATGTTGRTGDEKPSTAAASEPKAGASQQGPITDLRTLARAADNQLVGRQVKISGRVDRMGDNDGFWVTAQGGDSLYVLPAETGTTVTAGQTVEIEGHVLRLPEHMEQRLEKGTKVGNEEIYVYATNVRRGTSGQ